MTSPSIQDTSRPSRAWRLLRPKWLLAHAVVLVIVATFIGLGMWQMERHAERTALNLEGSARIALAPADFDTLLGSVPLEELEFRRVTVSGAYMPEDEVLVRSQVYLGTAGFHVVTPLATEDGRGVLVNRGWVPFTLDSVPVTQAPPPEGVVVVEGWIQASQRRPAGGAVEGEGRLAIVNRIDVDRLREQSPLDLAPVYVVATGERGVLPEPLRQPAFDDNGPHLAYAVQWFGFALVGLVGYFFLARRALSRRGSPRD